MLCVVSTSKEFLGGVVETSEKLYTSKVSLAVVVDTGVSDISNGCSTDVIDNNKILNSSNNSTNI